MFLLAKYFLELPFRPLLMRVFHDFEAPPTFEIFASLVPARSGWDRVCEYEAPLQRRLEGCASGQSRSKACNFVASFSRQTMHAD
ncbi:MAG: hypothetical protein HY232_00205 [Acidobacteria bacterium]|nr:hypothetical protein [Acidobacteriota bacterium]